MRCFIGIPLNSNIKNKIQKVQGALTRTGANIKMVEEENLHMTVKFLGDVNDPQINDIDNVKNILNKYHPFEIEIGSMGAFPSLDYIRVIWVGVTKGHKRIKKLIENVNTQLEKMGFQKEKNKITPHITIGRMKSGKNKNDVKNIIKKHNKTTFGNLNIDELLLYQSKLSRSGPMYKIIKKYEI